MMKKILESSLFARLISCLMIGLGVYLFILSPDNNFYKIVVSFFAALISWYFNQLKEFNLTSMSGKFKEKIKEADQAIERIKRVELDTYKNRVESLVNDIGCENFTFMSGFSFQTESPDEKILTLKRDLSLSEDDDKYVFQYYYNYKVLIAVKDLYKKFDKELNYDDWNTVGGGSEYELITKEHLKQVIGKVLEVTNPSEKQLIIEFNKVNSEYIELL
tara:strand:- start:36329 stop:36982 length:654 start_codon:yes stop_codon:yes gene_type:complete